MGLFSALIRTTVNVTLLPVDLAMDALTFGGVATDQRKPYTLQGLERIKDEAGD